MSSGWTEKENSYKFIIPYKVLREDALNIEVLP